ACATASTPRASTSSRSDAASSFAQDLPIGSRCGSVARAPSGRSTNLPHLTGRVLWAEVPVALLVSPHGNGVKRCAMAVLWHELHDTRGTALRGKRSMLRSRLQ